MRKEGITLKCKKFNVIIPMLNRKKKSDLYLIMNSNRYTEIDDGFENKIIVTGGVLIAWNSKKYNVDNL